MQDSMTQATSHLRLVWPQWQGGALRGFQSHVRELPQELAAQGYAIGAQALSAVLPPHTGPTVTVPVEMTATKATIRDGIEAKDVLLRQLADALRLIAEHDPLRITTVGGDCSVSVAAFTYLARKYPGDLAVVWIDAHPDVGTGHSEYPGFHAMAVSTITGNGDPEVTRLLPETIATARVALVGLHAWTDDDYPHIEQWGIRTFSPESLRSTSQPLIGWLRSTECQRVAIHFDVDAIDGREARLGMAGVPGGLSAAEVERITQDVARAADVVALTVAEFLPRELVYLRNLVGQMPLIKGKGARIPN